MTASRGRGDDFSLPAGNSRRRRRLKRTGAFAPVLTGAWGRSATNKHTPVYTGALLAVTTTPVLRRESFPACRYYHPRPPQRRLSCLTQTRGWRPEDIAEYERIKAQADKVVYVSRQYTRGCMHERNRHLVDNSSVCVCYLNRESGGTAYTVRYARERGLEIINLAIQ